MSCFVVKLVRAVAQQRFETPRVDVDDAPVDRDVDTVSHAITRIYVLLLLLLLLLLHYMRLTAFSQDNLGKPTPER